MGSGIVTPQLITTRRITMTMTRMTMMLVKAMSMEIGNAVVRGLRGDPFRDPEILSQTRDADPL